MELQHRSARGQVVELYEQDPASLVFYEDSYVESIFHSSACRTRAHAADRTEGIVFTPV